MTEPTYYSDAMTWLNGRATKIVIINNRGNEEVLWTNKDDRSIEDAISHFVESAGIDILKEINGDQRLPS